MLKCNPDKYRHAIASLNMSTEKEDELLHTLWDIMRLFAELGHGVNSINTIFPTFFENSDQKSKNLSESKKQ